MSPEREQRHSDIPMPKQTQTPQEHIITQGEWAGGVPWQFVATQEISQFPDKENCTAAFCVVVHQRKLCIVRQHSRGWELPGGHVDQTEEIEDTVHREVLEELGVNISQPKFFGYKKIAPPAPIEHADSKRFPDEPKKYYPFPYSYVPYFYAEAVELFDIPLANDVLEVKQVTFQEAQALFAPGHNHHSIIQHLLEIGAIDLL